MRGHREDRTKEHTGAKNVDFGCRPSTHRRAEMSLMDCPFLGVTQATYTVCRKYSIVVLS